MWMMLQQEKPEDFVISTGETHSVREFVEMAFRHVNRTIRWEGEAENEVGIEEETGIVRVKINKKYYRPTEVVNSLTSLSRKPLHFQHATVCRICFLEIPRRPLKS